MDHQYLPMFHLHLQVSSKNSLLSFINVFFIQICNKFMFIFFTEVKLLNGSKSLHSSKDDASVNILFKYLRFKIRHITHYKDL